ncbi:Uncharacterized protein DBV15_07652 [Temnothorax longispinosus]|uniref:Uncharacterized protein n=1 Tax=Temnothorax longispinosus TaxID=300112 RepID=A0A4S2L0L8_9HYME|nr:Uncharacterized protein DBV15_07652 [Temnothorax longispinosus]
MRTTFRLKAKKQVARCNLKVQPKNHDVPEVDSSINGGQWPFGILYARIDIHAFAGNSLGATHPLQRQAHSPYVKQTAWRARCGTQWRGESLYWLPSKQTGAAACVNTRVRLDHCAANNDVSRQKF